MLLSSPFRVLQKSHKKMIRRVDITSAECKTTAAKVAAETAQAIYDAERSVKKSHPKGPFALASRITALEVKSLLSSRHCRPTLLDQRIYKIYFN